MDCNRPKGKQLWKPRPSMSNPPCQSTSKPTGIRGMLCYGCGKEGHMIANCPEKKREKRQQLRKFTMSLDPEERDALKGFLQV